jgi:hypothetical protein
MAKTRKARTQKKHNKVLSIPELRLSMKHMDDYSNKLIATKSMKEGAKLFISEWKRVFGKVISSKVAESYLKNKMKLYKHGKTRRGKHRGGSNNLVLGAPLNHITRAGDYTSPAPNAVYPSMVTKGFWTPEPSILKDSETQEGVLPYPSTGSNKMGGGGLLSGLTSFAASSSFRPVVAQNPITTQQSAMLSWKGLPTGPGSETYDNPSLKLGQAKVYVS